MPVVRMTIAICTARHIIVQVRMLNTTGSDYNSGLKTGEDEQSMSLLQDRAVHPQC